MPDSIFSNFSPEDKQLWISFSDSAKQKVVDSLPKDKPTTGRTFTKRPPRRSVNVADVDEESSLEDDADEPPDDASPSLEVNQAQAKTSAKVRSVAFKEAHPVDVRRALSPRNPQASDAKRKTVKGYNVSLFPDILEDDSGYSSEDSLHLPAYDINALEADDYADDTSSDYLSDDSDFWNGN